MTTDSRCPVFNTNLLDENECIFVWELTVPSSKTEKLKKTLADADFNLDYVDITNNGETTSFEMTLSEDAHQDWEDALHEEGWVEQGDYDRANEITAKDIENLSPEAKALYERLKNS